MSRQLPPQPDLEQLKKQAKDLLKAHKSANSDAARRIKNHLPKYAERSEQEIMDASFSLREAQQVIAREYGFTSWQKLRISVSSVEQESSSPKEEDASPLPVENPPSYDERSLVRVEISGIHRILSYMDPTWMVYLKGKEDKAVAIKIGNNEGQALTLTLQKRDLPRPLSHHVLQNILGSFGGVVRRLVVHSIKEDVFYGHLLIHNQEKAIYIDCRPSDGMIIAAQNEAPIYVTPEVMEETGKSLEELDSWKKRLVEEELKRWKETTFLEQRDLPPEESLTIDEAAEHTHLDAHIILYGISRGLLKAYQATEHHEVRIEIENLVDYLRKQNKPIPQTLQR